MKTATKSFLREWWPLAVLLLGTSWLYAPYFNRYLNSTTTIISQYESPGQPLNWLFRSCDILAALIIGLVILRLIRRHRIEKKLAGVLLVFTAGSILDGYLAIGCPVSAQSCKVPLNGMTFLHGTETLITSIALFAASWYFYQRTKRKTTLLFILAQLGYLALTLITITTNTIGQRTLSQFIFQLFSMLWVVSILQKSDGVSPGGYSVRKLVAALVIMNGILAVAISVIDLPLFSVFRSLYFATSAPWLSQHTIIAGILLLYLGRHIYRGEANARLIVLFILGGETLKYSLLTPQIWVLTIYLVSFMLVFVSGSYFDRRSVSVRLSKRVRENLQTALIVLSVFMAVIGALSYLDHIGKLPRRIDATIDKTNSLRKHGRHFWEEKNVRRLANVALGGALGLMLYSLFRPRASSQVASEEDRQAAVSLLKTTSQSSEDYFKIWPEDKLYFWNQERSGFIAYKVSGSIAFALADPVAGSDDDKAMLLRNFVTYCRSQGWRAGFLMVNDLSNAMYEAEGFRLLKIGSSAVVDINEFSNDISRDKWWRWQANRSKKAELSYHTSMPPHSGSLLAGCAGVSREWLSRPGRREQSFALGYFNPVYLQQCVIHYLRDQKGDIVAFANELPIYSGERTTVDLIRFKPDIDGAMPALLMHAIHHWHSQSKFKEFDLGFVPLADQDATTVRMAKALAGKRFSAGGLEQFKNKFDPNWEPAYLAVDGDLADLAVIALRLEKVMKV